MKDILRLFKSSIVSAKNLDLKSSAQSGATQNSTQSTQRQFHHHHYQQSLIRPGQQQQHHNQHRHQSSATLRIHGQNPKNVLMWTVGEFLFEVTKICC